MRVTDDPSGTDMDLSLLKGTRDYLPSEQILRQRVLDVLRRTFESYGYSPLETPVLNSFELLASKYAGGAEILKETYSLSDQGKRELGLRYDLTVPFARIIGFYEGQRRQLQLPLKRYEIGKVFRDGPVRSGRIREFTQCDVDIVGTSDMSAEAELIAMAGEIFTQLKLPVVVRLNHRKVLAAILQTCSVRSEHIAQAILSIDKLEKIGWEAVCKELRKKQISKETLGRLDEFFQISGSAEDVLEQLATRLDGDAARAVLEELGRLLVLLPAAGFQGRLRLVPSLARGLEIYTGTVFECFLVDQQGIASSLAAGGRYDEIIGRFLEAEDPCAYPAVGMSFGLDVLYEALKQRSADAPKTVTQVYVVPIDTQKESLQMAKQMRAAGLKVDVAQPVKRVKKLFRYANQMEIPFVLTLGENELNEGVVNLKNMREEKEIRVPLDEAIRTIQTVLAVNRE